MPKFFTSIENIAEDKIYLSKEDINHIVNVLRMKEGDKLTVCDMESTDYECEIMNSNKNEFALKIISSHKSLAEPNVKITLFQGLPKHDKMELIIQKCVEIGINKIVPMETERIVVNLKDKEDKKISRWQKISESAAKQSGRGIIPEIANVVKFEDAIKTAEDYSLAIIPYENDMENKIKSVVNKENIKDIAIFIGPEGGFDEKEIEFAKCNGVNTVTLGNRILRTETASIVALTVMMYELGEI